MRLNARELSMMNSPLRAFSQRHIELRTFERLLGRAAIDLRGKRLLDAGCGNGLGLSLLDETFAPSHLAGFDLMPEQIERAKRRELVADIAVGDITAIAHADATFDGVFVFGILHHVPAWRSALRELARVLALGGALLVEEIHGTAVRLEDCFLRTSHPREASFDWPEFRGGLADAGLTIVAETGFVFGAMRSFCAIKTRI